MLLGPMLSFSGILAGLTKPLCPTCMCDRNTYSLYTCLILCVIRIREELAKLAQFEGEIMYLGEV